MRAAVGYSCPVFVSPAVGEGVLQPEHPGQGRGHTTTRGPATLHLVTAASASGHAGRRQGEWGAKG